MERAGAERPVETVLQRFRSERMASRSRAVACRGRGMVRVKSYFIDEFVSVLLVSSVCLLNSTYE